jgi:hypothetical protein
MMNFRLIKAALVNLLGENANGRFRVAGYQKRAMSMQSIKGSKRIAQVYYAGGAFPKSGGGPSGPRKHDMTFNIDLFVSMATSGDLRILDNPSASQAQLQTAQSTLVDAEDKVDDAFDEFIDDIDEIVMDARNRYLGHTAPVASRWITTVSKDNPVRYGELVTLTGQMILTCSKDEQSSGATPVPIQVIDVEVEANEDPVGRAGVIVGLGDFVVERGSLAIVRERGTDAIVRERAEPEA